MLNSDLSVTNQIMRPKAYCFDELVDRNTLANFMETDFIGLLFEKKYIYGDKMARYLIVEIKTMDYLRLRII